MAGQKPLPQLGVSLEREDTLGLGEPRKADSPPATCQAIWKDPDRAVQACWLGLGRGGLEPPTHGFSERRVLMSCVPRM